MTQVLIKNGRVWDGERFFFADVLTHNNVIARIEPNIVCEKAYVFDASGMIVSAGLVDCHMHMRGISPNIYGICAEMGCLPFGVTAACDAGGNQGSSVLLKQSAVKSVVFADSVIVKNHFDPTATRRHLALYGPYAIGIKVFYEAESDRLWNIAPLQEACAFAREQGLKVMVHCNHSPTSMLSIVQTLSPGDILTHIYHGEENNCTENDFEALRLARQKGVVLDSGFACYVHTDYAVFRSAIKAGLLPDTISTDLTKSSVFKRDGRYGLPMCMSMARTAGMAEDDIFRAVTSTPARVLGRDWGHLRIGGTADIAVLEYTNEGFCSTDMAGNTLESTLGYRCRLTLSDGVVLYKD